VFCIYLPLILSLRGIQLCNFYVYKNITNYNLYHPHDLQETLIKPVYHLFDFTVSIEIQILTISISNITKSMFHYLSFRILYNPLPIDFGINMFISIDDCATSLPHAFVQSV